MGFRKSIATKAADLFVQALGEVGIVAPLQHALNQFVAERCQIAMGFPGRHGAAKFIGLARTETGGNHGQFDDLFLEDRHPEGALQHLAYGIVGVFHRFHAVFSAQVGVHHVALYGARANDGDFDHKVVPGFRFQPREHVDLGAGLHLKDTDTVAFLQHGVGVRVFLRDILNGKRRVFLFTDQRQCFANGGEHAQGQDIHLHQPQTFQVVFVPLDNRAPFHGGILDRHQF